MTDAVTEKSGPVANKRLRVRRYFTLMARSWRAGVAHRHNDGGLVIVARESNWVSATLAHLDATVAPGRPGDDVACRTCPISLWYQDADEKLTCFCTALHENSWDGLRRPIIWCDGREQALAELAAKSLPTAETTTRSRDR